MRNVMELSIPGSRLLITTRRNDVLTVFPDNCWDCGNYEPLSHKATKLQKDVDWCFFAFFR